MLSEMFPCMDVPTAKVRLHPGAKDFLFEHYVSLRKTFSNVLGLIETDYLSIALINQADQLFFLSSKPSIEQNLIEKELWQYDGSYLPDFIYQEQPSLWTELYHPKYAHQLKQYKQENQGIITGISIPTRIDGYKVIFLFGFKSNNLLIQQKKYSQYEKLLAMGKYCLKEIRTSIPFPDQQKQHSCKPKLKLISNNKAVYEHASGKK